MDYMNSNPDVPTEYYGRWSKVVADELKRRGYQQARPNEHEQTEEDVNDQDGQDDQNTQEEENLTNQEQGTQDQEQGTQDEEGENMENIMEGEVESEKPKESATQRNEITTKRARGRPVKNKTELVDNMREGSQAADSKPRRK